MNLTSLLEQLGITYRREGQHHHARSGWVQVDCPWCSPRSGRFRLGINVSQVYANCWTCGFKRISNVLEELSDVTRRESYELLNQVARPRERPSGGPQTGRRVSIPRGLQPLGRAHRRYVKGRGFDPDELERLWGLQGIGISDTLGWRLWIPIHLHGELVSWTTRSIGDKTARYISASPESEKVHLRKLLYGADYARHAIVICEGPTDVWRIGPGAVAILGLNFSSAQVDLMSQYPVRVVCFDSEKPAQQRARHLARVLQSYPGETHLVKIETGKDVADADRAEVDEIRRVFLENDRIRKSVDAG